MESMPGFRTTSTKGGNGTPLRTELPQIAKCNRIKTKCPTAKRNTFITKKTTTIKINKN